MSAANTPYLPPELERLIFELAVSDNATQDSTAILLTAKRVYMWIRPLVFRVMNQLRNRSSPAPSFIRFPQLLSSVGHLVQYLLIGGGWLSGEDLGTILFSCPNLRNLAIWSPPAKLDLIPALRRMPHLTRLSTSLLDISYSELLIQPFSNLTHLEILGFQCDSWDGGWERFTHLPKLTHIGVGCEINGYVVSKLLLHCSHLKLLILAIYTDQLHLYSDLTGPLDELPDDNRLVLLDLESLTYTSLIHDWEKGANGDMDAWIFCELVVFARGRKYFSNPLPKWIPRTFDWEENLNEDGKKWFSELRLNDPWPT